MSPAQPVPSCCDGHETRVIADDRRRRRRYVAACGCGWRSRSFARMGVADSERRIHAMAEDLKARWCADAVAASARTLTTDPVGA